MKCATEDYSDANLPETRKAVFMQRYKEHFSLILYLGLNLMPLLMVKYLLFIALAIFYVVPLTMCWMLYASHIFDQYINEKHYPSMYRKGMKKEAAEDEMRAL